MALRSVEDMRGRRRMHHPTIVRRKTMLPSLSGLPLRPDPSDGLTVAQQALASQLVRASTTLGGGLADIDPIDERQLEGLTEADVRLVLSRLGQIAELYASASDEDLDRAFASVGVRRTISSWLMAEVHTWRKFLNRDKEYRKLRELDKPARVTREHRRKAENWEPIK